MRVDRCLWLCGTLPPSPQTSLPIGFKEKHRSSPGLLKMLDSWGPGPWQGARDTCADDRPGCPSGDLTRQPCPP